MSEKRVRRTFTPEFKRQVVRLYESGKPRADIIREYDLTASAFDKWVKQSQASGSFKENQRLMMENDSLKQAALISWNLN